MCLNKGCPLQITVEAICPRSSTPITDHPHHQLYGNCWLHIHHVVPCCSPYYPYMIVAAWTINHPHVCHPMVPDLNLHLPSLQSRLDQSPHTLPGNSLLWKRKNATWNFLWGCSWGLSDQGDHLVGICGAYDYNSYILNHINLGKYIIIFH